APVQGHLSAAAARQLAPPPFEPRIRADEQRRGELRTDLTAMYRRPWTMSIRGRVRLDYSRRRSVLLVAGSGGKSRRGPSGGAARRTTATTGPRNLPLNGATIRP